MSVRMQNEGSIVILYPETEEAREWFTEHLPAPTWCGGVVVEPRYVEPILVGLAEAGLEVV